MAQSGMGEGNYGGPGGDQGPEQFRGKEQGGSDPKAHLEIHTGKPHRVQIKVAIPIKEHPNFNFVGKLLGPKGASLKQLQEMTQTRMAILGRGSMRDKKKEEDLRTGGEPKYSHLNDELHVEVSAYAPPSEAYRRIAYAIDELSRVFVPDFNDGNAGPGPYPPHDMSVNGRGGQKPGFGFEDPSMGAARPPPGPVPPPGRGGAGYWSPARGAASRRVLQPRPGPAAAAPRRAPPQSAASDYSYDDSYGRYDSGGASSEYYAEPGMEGGESGFGGDDYSADQSRSGPARGYANRGRPYAASTRPY